MTTYAKIKQDGSLDHMGRIPHISNPSDDSVLDYAAAHGYKQLTYTPAPKIAATYTWEDTGDEIRQVWTELPLDEIRSQAMQRVQEWRNNAMNTVCELKSPMDWPLEYSQEAVMLAQGTLMLMLTGLCELTSWTDARNVRHEGLTLFDMKVIAAVLAEHIRRIQDKADSLRARISTSTAEGIALLLEEL